MTGSSGTGQEFTAFSKLFLSLQVKKDAQKALCIMNISLVKLRGLAVNPCLRKSFMRGPMRMPVRM
jgi:hypothetical protein